MLYIFSSYPQPTKKDALPRPSIDFRQKKVAVSIFNNPFREAEEEQFSVLEQHVNLTEGVPEEESNRIPCKAFRRGNCKRGNRCRFSHVLPGGQLANKPREDDEGSADPNQNQKSYASEPIRYKNKKLANQALPGGFISQTGLDQGEKRDTSSPDRESQPKRKKVGVTDSLVPPKRALEAFERTKEWKN